MVKICYLCKKGEIVHDKKMSGMFCTGCGECFELGAFTDEVQYRENERGQYMAVGTTYNVEKGFVNSKFSNHAQFLTSVDNAKSVLKRYCDKLYISESFAQISSGFYHQLLIKKFMNGRRLNVVLAACLYISVRSEGANVILLDISDVSEANVYDIGRYYFQIIRILHFNIQTVDPCEYTIRFVDMLNLGDRGLPQVKRIAVAVRDTANRLVQRMKRDWIHFGRRPSGVCAAAVLVSARINNVRCSIKDIISIAKVCESTIRKRINEFVETPASQLTYKEFMSQDLDHEEDPPSYKISNSMTATVEANLDKVEKYQKIIEEHLKDSRAKVRGMYAKFLKEILSTQEAIEDDKKLKSPDEETQIIQEAIIDQNILAVNDKIIYKITNELKQFNENGNPSAEEIEYWADFRPSAKSLGLLKKESEANNEIKIDYEDLLEKNLDDLDLDENEINAYVVSDSEEISQRQIKWNILNKDYLDKEEEKESLKRMQSEAEAKKEATSKNNARNRKKRRKIDNNNIEASSTSEAVEAACKAKLIPLNGINLKKLFNEDTNSSNEAAAKTVNPVPAVEVLKSDASSNDTVCYKDAADFVKIYHSYALKSLPENEAEAIEMETSDTVDTEKDTDSLTTEKPETGSSDTKLKSIDRSDYEEEEEEEEEIDNDDDYFNDDDDELSKIKQKYSVVEDDGGEFDDIEECGF